MDAADILSTLMQAIDERRWDALGEYLHPDFVCRYVHTGENLDRDSWVRLNAEYPGFDRLRVEELVGGGDAAACRSHVTGHGASGTDHFECATFVHLRDGLIHRMTEVWTDVGQTRSRPRTGPQ
ncbi:nuclear transport factor 2 family protein [Microbacterium elymi]|uniref:Nuclear transport factor 2 family protein n=1 Tax=Microbacterium elymi TaxID=2909587 RepID=A0ABY5NM00_9MICO|nr:nuclear transport factor 2 family protein [Microbacterium elymi]UUT36086.1 nuclear transport factor 2 family protein [Microbacterium elymi]